MKKAIIALALVCTPMVWAHGPGHHRPGENPHDSRHRAAAHDARPVPPPARPQAPGVRPPAPGPQRPAPGVQRPQPPRPQAPAVHRPAPQGHPATPAPKETTRPSRHQNVVPSFNSPSTDVRTVNEGPSQARPNVGSPPQTRHHSTDNKEGPTPEPGLEGSGAVQKGTGRSPIKPINSSSFGTR